MRYSTQPLLRLVFALVLLMQSSFAMAVCVRFGRFESKAEAFQIVICTSQGLVLADMSDSDDRREAPQHAQSSFCVACHILPGIDLPPPPEIPVPYLVALEASSPRGTDTPSLGARAPPYRPTGPPTRT